MTGYTVVPMDRSHLEQIAALERMCFSDPWSVGMLEEELYNPLASFLVAEGEGGAVLGYAGMHAVLDEGYITNIAVQPALRRQGIATALLETFCRFGQVHLATLSLEVRASNEAAIAVYAGHGFARVGVRRGYYRHPEEDAVIMTRTFTRTGEAVT